MAGALHLALIVTVQEVKSAKMGSVSTPVSVLSAAQVHIAHWGVVSPITVMASAAQKEKSAPDRSVNPTPVRPLGVAHSRDV